MNQLEKTQKKVIFLLMIFQISIYGCISAESKTTPIIEKETAEFSKGADVSWLPQMEKSGFKFYNELGQEKDCLQILKDNGMNTIRLRTWVNPSEDAASGHCSTTETVITAVRAKKMGFKIMIDFHYSDSWADPGKQIKPAAWANHTFDELQNDVYVYTAEVMNALKNEGIYPEWVQIGNEINPGMLLPDGSSDNMENLSKLINKGYKAVKEISPVSKIIIHLANGTDNGLFRWFFDGLTKNSTEFDIIGLSYYPYWDKKNYRDNIDALESNMKDMIARYGKEVMIVETGGLRDEPSETFDMLSAVIQKVRALPDGKGLGVLYWEPQSAFAWSKYSLSCWGDDGRPTAALKAFLE